MKYIQAESIIIEKIEINQENNREPKRIGAPLSQKQKITNSRSSMRNPKKHHSQKVHQTKLQRAYLKMMIGLILNPKKLK